MGLFYNGSPHSFIKVTVEEYFWFTRCRSTKPTEIVLMKAYVNRKSFPSIPFVGKDIYVMSIVHHLVAGKSCSLEPGSGYISGLSIV